MSIQSSRRFRHSAHRTALLMALEAASLAVMSVLHLTGALAGGSKPYRPAPAGIAEAVICIALLAGATAIERDHPNARSIALATVTFAILGFLIGLSFTITGGKAVDVAYHAAVLPLLLLTLVPLGCAYPRRRRPI
jgi:hypothetical protein